MKLFHQQNRLTKENIARLFHGTKDVVIKDIHVNDEVSYTLIYCIGVCDTEKIDKNILPELKILLTNITKKQLKTIELSQLLPKRALQQYTSDADFAKKIFEGQLGIFIEDKNETVYFLDLIKAPKRMPEEPNTEISIRGPKDGFIEDIQTNIGLIRKRLKTNSLIYEQFEIGRRTFTKVGLFYIHDIAKEEVINEVKKRLKEISIDGLYSATQLEELLIKKRFLLFPTFQYTGRPDFAVEALLRGRFVLLIDGSPTVIIAPITLSLLIKTAEDTESNFIFVAFERFLRILGLIIALLLPGFWVSLIGFHQNQIPFIFLTSLAQVRQGIPIPFNLEAIVMLLIFELFREAGNRLPKSIGIILSVVGGLIIGDAAIRSGLSSPAMVVIIATSAVATFALANQSLGFTITILRLYILLWSAILGLFGFLIAIFSILMYLSTLRPFNVPYLSPVSPLRKEIGKAILRPKWNNTSLRSQTLTNQDYDITGDKK